MVLEHDTLRNNHLFEISQHENDTVVPTGWQVWQEQVDDLTTFPPACSNHDTSLRLCLTPSCSK